MIRKRAKRLGVEPGASRGYQMQPLPCCLLESLPSDVVAVLLSAAESTADLLSLLRASPATYRVFVLCKQGVRPPPAFTSGAASPRRWSATSCWCTSRSGAACRLPRDAAVRQDFLALFRPWEKEQLLSVRQIVSWWRDLGFMFWDRARVECLQRKRMPVYETGWLTAMANLHHAVNVSIYLNKLCKRH
ncbi:hypothetical protein PG996_013537 [Apiospora saccharicola]|uniref:F-box domain-containing protein n=1 Tax=Apiospora saccharicola TaxID=335842 RepID=A0ABR1U5P7_9PEZI